MLPSPVSSLSLLLLEDEDELSLGSWAALSPLGGFSGGPPLFSFRLSGPGPGASVPGGRCGAPGAWLVCSGDGSGGGGGGGGGASGGVAGVSSGSPHVEADLAVLVVFFNGLWTPFISADDRVLPFFRADHTSSPNARETRSNLRAVA